MLDGFVGGEPLVSTCACGETIRASPPQGRHGIDVFEYHSEMVNIEWKSSRDSEIIQYSSARGDSMQYISGKFKSEGNIEDKYGYRSLNMIF